MSWNAKTASLQARPVVHRGRKRYVVENTGGAVARDLAASMRVGAVDVSPWIVGTLPAELAPGERAVLDLSPRMDRAGVLTLRWSDETGREGVWHGPASR